MISEILEVPALMETCLRNGSYEDALDLRAFVSKTALLHPNMQVQVIKAWLVSTIAVYTKA